MAELFEHLPRYYKDSVYLKDISGAIDKEDQRFLNSISELKLQFIVNTSTYALEKYEEEYNLPINPGGLTIEGRRSRIMAKMRSAGTVTKQLIKTVVESWSGGEVEIIEDFNNYTFEIKFVSDIGIPSNIEDVYKSIEEIKPAHLGVTYTFKYNIWNTLKPKTWDYIKTKTWSQVLEGAI